MIGYDDVHLVSKILERIVSSPEEFKGRGRLYYGKVLCKIERFLCDRL